MNFISWTELSFLGVEFSEFWKSAAELVEIIFSSSDQFLRRYLLRILPLLSLLFTLTFLSNSYIFSSTASLSIISDPFEFTFRLSSLNFIALCLSFSIIKIALSDSIFLRTKHFLVELSSLSNLLSLIIIFVRIVWYYSMRSISISFSMSYFFRYTSE